LNVAILNAQSLPTAIPKARVRTFVVPTSPMSLRHKTDAWSFPREAA
jgi:hypothetical protein